jgi:malate synthase
LKKVLMSDLTLPAGVQVTGSMDDGFEEILTSDALALLADLHRKFEPRRTELLAARNVRESELARGGTLDFLPATAEVRAANWRVPAPAPGLTDRRVEITGPTDKKMAINALNSGAKVWLADFEDANTPLWHNMIQGQRNLRDAIDGVLTFTSDEGKFYALGENLATIVVRPRGWHLQEKHLTVDGDPISGGLLDFGLYLAHCGQRQINRGLGPYYYLPKMQSHLEARLWNDVFVSAQETLGIPRGTIRATALIETIPAAFEMEEILYELGDHAAGLNAGRWDYLFSIIAKFRSSGREFLLPDRNSITMTAPMMRAYTELLVSTCHKRGAMAIGGMAAFIPSRRDAEANDRAMSKVREDKSREVADGFDGSWVAHPDLVALCQEVFDGVLGSRPNQLERTREEVSVTAAQLLDVTSTPGEITEQGLRSNISVALQYLAAWLRGTGAVAVFGMMEDAATAEISRSQIWQWLHNDVVLSNGQKVTPDFVEQILEEELAKLGNPDSYAAARALFVEVALSDEFVDFLTLPAYQRMP